MSSAKLPQKLQQLRDASVRATLRNEFSAFFTAMTTAKGDWPGVSDQEFVNALADSLLDVGKQRGKGGAILQTLVYELQDRINNDVSESKKGK